VRYYDQPLMDVCAHQRVTVAEEGTAECRDKFLLEAGVDDPSKATRHITPGRQGVGLQVSIVGDRSS